MTWSVATFLADNLGGRIRIRRQLRLITARSVAIGLEFRVEDRSAWLKGFFRIKDRWQFPVLDGDRVDHFFCNVARLRRHGGYLIADKTHSVTCQ